MKSVWKGLIAGIVLVAIGAGIVISVLAVNGWSLKQEYEIKTYVAESDIHSLFIDMSSGEFRCEYYDGDKIEITYPESKRYSATIGETDGTLNYATNLKWYLRFFNFSFLWDMPETVVRLPRDKAYNLKLDIDAGTADIAGGAYGNLVINMDAGTINIASGTYANVNIDVDAGTLKTENIECAQFNCDMDAGTVKLTSLISDKFVCDVDAGTMILNSLTCPDVKADLSAGKLVIDMNAVKSEYTIFAKVSAGECNVSDQTGSTDKVLDVRCSAGTLKVNFNG